MPHPRADRALCHRRAVIGDRCLPFRDGRLALARAGEADGTERRCHLLLHQITAPLHHFRAEMKGRPRGLSHDTSSWQYEWKAASTVKIVGLPLLPVLSCFLLASSTYLASTLFTMRGLSSFILAALSSVGVRGAVASSCVLNHVSTSPPTDAAGVALASYSYCGGTLNVTVCSMLSFS